MGVLGQIVGGGPCHIANMETAMHTAITTDSTVQADIKALIGFKGYYATEAALNTAYPTASGGDWATVEDTDTSWVWDTTTSAWIDSGNKFTGTDSIPFYVDGGGFTLITGEKTPYRYVPFDCTITGWALRASESSTMTVDINYHASITGTPASICASALPALSGVVGITSTTLTGWTTTLARGGLLSCNITVAPAAATWCSLLLNVQRT